eukprot:TRINITY_DN4584_c0_g1_i5.p1 TRINITY_DN4584_c0_g1~~TRINITY_DN4584_c0_g1_i5.p1  ORF type:complete len:130 (-),score=12.86 TRINITY_DN4584_c0_g1_i5:45-434(-)
MASKFATGTRITPTRLRTPAKDIFTLTPSAKNRIKQLIEGKEDFIGIRVGTKSGGCNGLRYSMDFIKKIPEGDDVVTCDDLTISVEPKALLAVIGTEMDFVESPVKSEFVFRNPNAVAQCGCGESFTVG